MELIDQNTKKLMEDCKIKARDAGLVFEDETLEYIVTNKDLIKLSPKVMVPTLYDYWVNDVEVIQGEGEYELYPHNAYETVINSRPAISFYNDNNPDWLNKMIFYHVLGHIDFFQNNQYFKKTWDDDFVGKALADKRLIEKLRSQEGRWVDYVIEFSRGVDNILGYYDELAEANIPEEMMLDNKVKYYFENFLGKEIKSTHDEILSKMKRYNELVKENKEEKTARDLFFKEISLFNPEFNSKFEKYSKMKKNPSRDVLDFLIKNSPKLKKEENSWMPLVMQIVRETQMYFSPQRRDKILNEGWATYWHQKLFLEDPMISGHEIDYAKINAGVTTFPKIGVNPYALGNTLLNYIEELAEKGKVNYDFHKIQNVQERKNYDKKTGRGRDYLFKVRENLSDATLIKNFIDQDFVDRHHLMVIDRRLNLRTWNIEYYVKSKKAEDYKKKILDGLYHPPKITVDLEKTSDERLYLKHHFEGKQLVKPYIPNTMIGIEFLWGNEVQLETTEVHKKKSLFEEMFGLPTKWDDEDDEKFEYRKVLYTMKDKKLEKKYLD